MKPFSLVILTLSSLLSTTLAWSLNQRETEGEELSTVYSTFLSVYPQGTSTLTSTYTVSTWDSTVSINGTAHTTCFTSTLSGTMANSASSITTSSPDSTSPVVTVTTTSSPFSSKSVLTLGGTLPKSESTIITVLESTWTTVIASYVSSGTTTPPQTTSYDSTMLTILETTLTEIVTNYLSSGTTTLALISTITPRVNLTISNGITLNTLSVTVGLPSASNLGSTPGTDVPDSSTSSPSGSGIQSPASTTTGRTGSLLTTTSSTPFESVSSGSSSTSSLPLVNLSTMTITSTTLILFTTVSDGSTSTSTSQTVFTASIIVSISTGVTLSPPLSSGSTTSTPSPSASTGQDTSLGLSNPTGSSATTSQTLSTVTPTDSGSSAPFSADTGSQAALASTFQSSGVPTYTGDSTGLVTDKNTVTWALINATEYVAETGVDDQGSTITISHITTLLFPSAIGSEAPGSAAPGATSYFTVPATTTGPQSCNITDSHNPFVQSTSCKFAPGWASTTRTYEPVCTGVSGGLVGTQCLCPVCTLPQKECLDGSFPSAGSCPTGWLCGLSSRPGAATPVWSWPTTTNYDLPWCVTQNWDTYSTCITAANLQSCSVITYTTSLSTSTSTDANGTVWAMPFRTWRCSDALCNENSFALPFPFGWIQFILSCPFLDSWSCITWFFRGFPPGPKIAFPPWGPEPDDIELRPTAISTTGPDQKPTEITPSPYMPSSIPMTSQTTSSSSSCSDQVATYTFSTCSTDTVSNTITTVLCTPSYSLSTGCSATGSISTSTIPCSTGVQTSWGVECPLNSDNTTATTSCNSTIIGTYTGCSGTTTTAAECPIYIDYNDPAIALTLSSWLSQFTFTLPEGNTSQTFPLLASTSITTLPQVNVSQTAVPSLTSASTSPSLTSEVSSPSSYTSISAASTTKTSSTTSPTYSAPATSTSSSIAATTRSSSSTSSIEPSSSTSSTVSTSASSSSTSPSPVDVDCTLRDGYAELQFEISDSVKQQTFVKGDQSVHYGLGSSRDLLCSYVDVPADGQQTCTLCDSYFHSISLVSNGTTCGFTVTGTDLHLSLSSGETRSFFGDQGVQLNNVTCNVYGDTSNIAAVVDEQSSLLYGQT